jgi:small subunit ribosomal protein S1
MKGEHDRVEHGDEGPPPPAEAWWAAVLADDPGGPPAGRTRPRARPADGKDPAGLPSDWMWARGLFERDETVELPAVGYNRGGLLVSARSLRGFVPISHLVAEEHNPAAEVAADQLPAFVGRRLNLKVIEYDPEKGRLVLSQRAALAGPGRRVELLERLQPGDRVRGTVTNITHFGVFVDLGGVEGLIHVSELSWARVARPTDAVRCGQELEVKVLSVDREHARVALSLKELQPDPWSTVEGRYRVGDLIQGTVTNVVKFGAFVALEHGLEGLIHLSEMGEPGSADLRPPVHEGQMVTVRVVHIDPVARRLGLSLRQVPAAEPGESGPAHPW